MKVLVINSGSSSIKYQLHDAEIEQILAKGIVARIGEEGSHIQHHSITGTLQRAVPVPSHRVGLELIMETLLHSDYGVLHEISDISAVGHRAVHGGDTFFESTLITDEVIKKLEDCIPLAPLHNPANLLGMRESQRILPHVPHVAVFDTAFHQAMPPHAYLYALPYELIEKCKIRKYGFHGTSCRYVSRRAAEILGKPLAQLNMILCHLGNGVTIAAVEGGKSVDTSIGFATFSGVMMGTRCGDIDPGLIFYLNRQYGTDLDQIESILYRNSGLLGISGVSNDLQEITEHARCGNERCRLAMKMFSYQVKKYIGAYTAVMGGIHAVIFTAGIGENSSVIRQMICEGLEPMGIHLSESQNKAALGAERIISQPDSPISVIVIPTDEEKLIAKDTLGIASRYLED